MGLSNTGNGSDLTSLQVALDLANSLRILMSDPKALEKAATDAYAITEREQKKAEEALASIGKNEALLANQRELQKKIDADTAANDAKAKEISDAWAKFSKEASELKKWEADVKKQAEEVRVAKAAVAEREHALEVGNSKLVTDTSALEKKKKDFSEYEASMRTKIEQLQKITEGL